MLNPEELTYWGRYGLVGHAASVLQDLAGRERMIGTAREKVWGMLFEQGCLTTPLRQPVSMVCTLRYEQHGAGYNEYEEGWRSGVSSRMRGLVLPNLGLQSPQG